DAELLQERDLQVLADLVGHGPLVPLFARLGPEEDLLPPGGPLRPAALVLAAVEADDHAQVPLRQEDAVHRRPVHAGGRKQLVHGPIDDAGDFLPVQPVLEHGVYPEPLLRWDHGFLYKSCGRVLQAWPEGRQSMSSPVTSKVALVTGSGKRRVGWYVAE